MLQQQCRLNRLGAVNRDLPAKTGMAYSPPESGYGRYQPYEEGALFPLPLEAIFIGKYGGWCTSGIASADTDTLDTLFRAHRFPLGVDRTRLKEYKEVWIHVRNSRSSLQSRGGRAATHTLSTRPLAPPQRPVEWKVLGGVNGA